MKDLIFTIFSIYHYTRDGRPGTGTSSMDLVVVAALDIDEGHV